MNQELPDVQAEFRKGSDRTANIHWIIEKVREFPKNIYFCFIDYTKAFDCVDHNKYCGKLLKRWEYQITIPVSWETCMQVKKQQSEHRMEQPTGSRLRKEYGRAVCCHRLSNLYAEHIMRNAGLDELQAGIKIGGRNINSFRYVDDTTLMAESKEELNSLLMRVKEES